MSPARELDHDGLIDLLPGHARGWRSPIRLPPGRLVIASTPLRRDAEAAFAEGAFVGAAAVAELSGPPVCWLTDGPVPAELWSVLRAEHPRSGLWPLLVWEGGDAFGIYGEDTTSLEELDAADLLRRWWTAHSHEQVPPWSGLAPPTTVDSAVGDPDQIAGVVATFLSVSRGQARLALVPAGRSADVLGLSGWTPCDADSHFAGALSAVVRTWEDRFGVRVVAVGRGTLWLSVAAPPRTVSEAVQVAAEHAAFCPDIEPEPEFEWRIDEPHFPQYAGSIVGRTLWRFWWD